MRPHARLARIPLRTRGFARVRNRWASLRLRIVWRPRSIVFARDRAPDTHSLVFVTYDLRDVAGIVVKLGGSVLMRWQVTLGAFGGRNQPRYCEAECFNEAKRSEARWSTVGLRGAGSRARALPTGWGVWGVGAHPVGSQSVAVGMVVGSPVGSPVGSDAGRLEGGWKAVGRVILPPRELGMAPRVRSARAASTAARIRAA